MSLIRRLVVALAFAGILSATLAQTTQQSPPSQPNQQQQKQQAKPKCSDNGAYVNSRGETVPRPENCSAAPAGATAQCRDGTYSFSHSRSGTCSHHGGVAKWL
jgi:hypothetical protein